MTDAQLEQVKKALTLAAKYVRDPDERPSMVTTLEYRLPKTRVQQLQKEIEDVEDLKYAAEFIRDTLLYFDCPSPKHSYPKHDA